MALLLRNALDLYYYLNDEASDPRVKDFLLMSNPFPTIAILTVYLYFILKWGPNYMKDRKPFNLDTLMIVYNVIQIIACCLLLRQGWMYAYGKGYSLFCEPVDYSPSPDAIEVARGCHAYYLLKIADLLDTVFFVLRKKDNQVSFLHLYHHTGMVVLTWTATKFLPGGHSIFTGFINSIIHIVMYAYYLVTAFSPKYKNNVWWKKYITQMQIIQFFMIGTHWAALLFQESCGYPKWPVAIMIPQNFFMLALFGDFYRKAYILKKPKVESAQENGLTKLSNTSNGTNGIYQNGVHRNGFVSNGINGSINNNGTNGSLINGLTKRGKTNGVSITTDTSNLLQRHLATSQQFENI
ncbi:Elongation of very long chain fatty acids protein [Pseudolycoriella hygida]|uniref:Elongation of very long chain fatty acids protein n=1 Tax=Pseudolycoriella hygida TaxID=35572 RepID=A0A9Q0RYR4_9DIPT|nr:Elongation of very long chain fatty acids protein [Pseudolycoriella hygida]